MRIPRAYVDHQLRAEQQLNLPDFVSRHLVQVMRLRVGDKLVLFNGDGRDYPGEIIEAHRSHVSVQIEEPGELEPIPPLEIRLGIGISKGERMDFTLQKSVELGATTLTPLLTERSVVRISGERLAKRQTHWQGVVVAACEQSGRRRMPQLNQTESLEDWLKVKHPSPLLLDHRGRASFLHLAPPGDTVTLLIGPEGGLAPRERGLAQAAGFACVRLGPRILRTETAPLAALAIVQALWGDMRD